MNHHNDMELKDWLWLIVIILAIGTFTYAVLSGKI